MKVFLTGGQGFLGRTITQYFLNHGAQITLLTRSKTSKLTHPHLKFIKGDITDNNSLIHINDPYDVLIHAAAHMPKNSADDTPQLAISANITGTLNVLQTIGRNSRKIIYVSSIDVYGGSTNAKDSLDEESPLRPRTYYGATKLAGEQLAQVFCQTNSLPLTVLRFTVLYGPGDTINRAIPNFIKSALSNQPIAINNPDTLRDYLSTSEAARALHLTAHSKKTGIYVIGSGTSVSIREAARTIVNKINPQLKIITSTNTQPGFHVRLNSAKAKKELKFIAKSFPYDLDSAILWHQKHSQI